MRPKLLQIEGLQSFRDMQQIDFEQLGETGLFGIFGPTGSGKSTVLDAITFALYGKVKRADGGTQGIINSTLNLAKVYFSFILTRDGQEKTYRVERVYQRKKGSENSCEPKLVRLIEITSAGEIPLCDKATDVTKKIKDLLGLSHEDFTRAVVLPQNSFQEFLLLNNADRRKMLERIFYLEEYGKKLIEKLTRKLGMIRSRLDQLNGELQGYADASDEALEQVKKEQVEAEERRIFLEKRWKKLESQFSEAREVWGFAKELAEVKVKEQEHLASRSEMEQMRYQLQRAQAAAEVWPVIEKCNDWNEKLAIARHRLQEISQVLPALTEKLTGLRSKEEEHQQQMTENQPQLAERRTRLMDALALQQELKIIDQEVSKLQDQMEQGKRKVNGQTVVLQREKSQLAEMEAALTAENAQVVQLTVAPEYREAIRQGLKMEQDMDAGESEAANLASQIETGTQKVQTVEQQLAEVEKIVESLMKQQEKLLAERQNLSSQKPGEQQELLQKKERLYDWRGILQGLREKREELLIWQKEIEKRTRQLADGQIRQTARIVCKDQAAIQLDAEKKALEQAISKAELNTIQHLAAALCDGAPCPVCGSLHHPHPADSSQRQETEKLKQQLLLMKENVEKLTGEWQKKEQEVELAAQQMVSYEQRTQEIATELERKKTGYQNIKQQLPETWHTWNEEKIAAELEKLHKEIEKQTAALDSWEKAQEKIHETQEKLQKELTIQQGQAGKLQGEKKVQQEHLVEMRQALQIVRQKNSLQQARYDKFLQEHQLDSAAKEWQHLTEQDHALQAARSRITQWTSEIQGKRGSIEQINNVLLEFTRQLTTGEADFRNKNQLKQESQIKLQKITGGAEVEGEIEKIDTEIAQNRKLQQEYKEKIQDLATEQTKLIAEQGTILSEQNVYLESQNAETLRLQEMLRDKNFQDEREVESFCLPTAKQEELTRALSDYDQYGSSLQLQKTLVEQKLHSRMITEAAWEQINQEYQATGVAREEAIAAHEVVKSRVVTLEAKHQRWVELTKQIEHTSYSRELLEQIQKLLRGDARKENGFVEYIAEERLRYVAAKASETLGFMTQYKYALELDAEAGFIIRDNANGGVHRKVASLSGGETFLTSLSLALALSEQIQLKGQSPLEFFFLDEGFGTLDSQLLDTVMDSLERLSRKDRMIGLISHVPELRSRMARRLIVEPPQANGVGSKVHLEKA